ncbi:MAG: putative GntR family transcriptional regulator [Clostridiales bacterium]|jgi:GntR family transcriptional repressor for pyruvate dehydrogenase complex|nr:putative GntR family transcriptional regulator [Clostridiales bacterium]
MELDKIRSSPKLPELVIQTFFNAITNGEIKVNQELPSERELSEKLGVSRGSLREGLSILEFLGVITNQGNRKVLSRDTDAIEKIMKLLRLSGRQDIIYDFIEFRRAIEPFAIKLACERATPEDINKIEETIIDMRKDIDNLEADYRFHVCIAEASHNGFLATVTELLISMLDSIRHRLIESPGRKELLLKVNTEIFEAIRQRDGELAQTLILNHLENIEENMKIMDEYKKQESE